MVEFTDRDKKSTYDMIKELDLKKGTISLKNIEGESYLTVLPIGGRLAKSAVEVIESKSNILL